MIPFMLACFVGCAFAASDCRQAFAQHAVCQAANLVAIHAMGQANVDAVIVMQDVSSGALVVFAASEPSRLDVSTAVLPLSLSKIFLAASWWDHKEPDFFQNPGSGESIDVHEMLVGGSDSAGRQLALTLRKATGTEAVLSDLQRYGFNRDHEPFWAEVGPQWKKRLAPQPAYAELAALDDAHWASALSIGESNLMITALHVSRFFQAVGNRGLLCLPVARRITKTSKSAANGNCIGSTRIVQEETTGKLISALADTVKRGSAKRVADALHDIGWTLGGKTGTGGRAGAPLTAQDGWFAGLIFDQHGKPRYTVATFVRRGGLGSGHAADISVQAARYLAGE